MGLSFEESVVSRVAHAAATKVGCALQKLGHLFIFILNIFWQFICEAFPSRRTKVAAIFVSLIIAFLYTSFVSGSPFKGLLAAIAAKIGTVISTEITNNEPGQSPTLLIADAHDRIFKFVKSRQEQDEIMRDGLQQYVVVHHRDKLVGIGSRISSKELINLGGVPLLGSGDYWVPSLKK